MSIILNVVNVQNIIVSKRSSGSTVKYAGEEWSPIPFFVSFHKGLTEEPTWTLHVDSDTGLIALDADSFCFIDGMLCGVVVHVCGYCVCGCGCGQMCVCVGIVCV